MADGSEKDRQVILEKVPEDKQPETALLLSGCFSLPPASTKGIAASGPIALLSDLTRDQAEAILAELAPSVPEGVVIRLAAPGEESRVSRLQWPRPPRIYGRDIADFIPAPAAQEVVCPHCGGSVPVIRDGEDLKTVPARKDKRRSADTVVHPPPANERDPLFSGVKPLAGGTGSFASIRSLQAGDTGFWTDLSGQLAGREPPPPPVKAAGETSSAKKSTGKIASGLAAFMKPGAFSVVTGRTREPQAVKMIAEILGIGEGEARERCLSLGLCVARDIALDEAQSLVNRLKNLGAKARIVKPK